MASTRHSSGIWGGVSIMASVALLFELGGCPVTGGLDDGPTSMGRTLFFGALAVISGFASMRRHHQAEKDGSSRASPRINLIEGILFSTVGSALFAAGIWWWTTSGGFGGFHFPALIIGGAFVLLGLGRFHRPKDPMN